METRQFDSLRLRAMLVRFISIASLLLPFVLAACGQDDSGGGGGGAPGY